MLDGTCHVRNSYSEMYDSYIDMYISDIQSCNHIFIILVCYMSMQENEGCYWSMHGFFIQVGLLE